jgi:hypothetical protein
MDKLDQLLSKKHDYDLPEGFIERIRLNFRRKYYFRQRMLALSAALLILAGFCVVLPALTTVNGQLILPLPMSLQFQRQIFPCHYRVQP